MSEKSSATVKALAHPIRRHVIAEMARGFVTPSDVAERIGEPLGVVSYHFRMLAQYGVIEVNFTEPRRGALQHFYTFTPLAVEEFVQVRDLATEAIRSARRGPQKVVAA